MFKAPVATPANADSKKPTSSDFFSEIGLIFPGLDN